MLQGRILIIAQYRPHLFQWNAKNVTITDYKASKPIAW